MIAPHRPSNILPERETGRCLYLHAVVVTLTLSRTSPPAVPPVEPTTGTLLRLRHNTDYTPVRTESMVRSTVTAMVGCRILPARPSSAFSSACLRGFAGSQASSSLFRSPRPGVTYPRTSRSSLGRSAASHISARRHRERRNEAGITIPHSYAPAPRRIKRDRA